MYIGSSGSREVIREHEFYIFDANIFYSFLLGSINKDNEDTFVHNTLHNLIDEIFRDPMLELVW